jgi:ABC-type multidrug transport system ATPase subunit
MKGLGKIYPPDSKVLNDIWLSFLPGAKIGVLGLNGAGKSTLLRIMAGLLEASDGEVVVDGHPAGTPDARAATSYVPDEPVLYDDLSVREHLLYVGALHGMTVTDEMVDELTARLGLTARVDDLPARFSRGLRQKAGLAVGFVRPYSLLLLDEPFVGLDAPGRAALLELLDEASDAGATLVIATHDPSFVERVDRCVALRDGSVVHDGAATTEDVLRLVGG